jgi:hypothetical protein
VIYIFWNWVNKGNTTPQVNQMERMSMNRWKGEERGRERGRERRGEGRGEERGRREREGGKEKKRKKEEVTHLLALQSNSYLNEIGDTLYGYIISQYLI